MQMQTTLIVAALVTLIFGACQRDNQDTTIHADDGAIVSAPATTSQPMAPEADMDTETQKSVAEILTATEAKTTVPKTIEQPAMQATGLASITNQQPIPQIRSQLPQSTKASTVMAPATNTQHTGKSKTSDTAHRLYLAGHQAAEKHHALAAQRYFLSACQEGSIPACHRYGWYLQSSGNKENAMRFYKRGCDLGYGKSCNNIGSIYEAQQKWEQARNFYSWSCIHKHDSGCKNLRRIRNASNSLQVIPLKKKEGAIPLFVH